MRRNAIEWVRESSVRMMNLFSTEESHQTAAKRKYLNVIINNDLKFDPHIRSMCEKAAEKLGVLNKEYPHY